MRSDDGIGIARRMAQGTGRDRAAFFAHPVRPAQPRIVLSIALLAVAGGCSAVTNPGFTATQPGQTSDVAVRSMPVVPGRKARVFIFAGLGDKCEPLAAPEISITKQPAKGDVSFVPGQDTTIAYSARGTCLGQKAAGTGVYYTAREGADGTDSFAVSAKLASGETVSRAFEVTIAQ
jgi:hypothetical protein